MGTKIESPSLVVDEKYRYPMQVKIVLQDLHDVIEHFVQVKGGDHRLTGVVKYGYFLHFYETASATNWRLRQGESPENTRTFPGNWSVASPTQRLKDP